MSSQNDVVAEVMMMAMRRQHEEVRRKGTGVIYVSPTLFHMQGDTTASERVP